MLDKFLIALCDSDLSVLVIDWTDVTEQDVQEAWQNILDEYRTALKSKEQEFIENISKDINLLITKKNIINACLNRLAISYSKEIVQELGKWTLVLEKFDTSDPELYKNDLQRIRDRNSRIDVDIRHLEIELKNRLPKGIENKTDKFYFEKLIVQLEKHKKTPIIKSQTTVANFVFTIVDMLMRAEEIDRQNNYS